jgi:hypothetical protein
MMLKVKKHRITILFEIEWVGDPEEAGRNAGKRVVHMTLELRPHWHLRGFQVMKARGGCG